MYMEDNEVENLIYYISSGTHLTIINDDVVVFKFPDNYTKQLSEIYYKKEYEQSIKEGLLKREELEKLIDSRNIYTKEDRDKVSRLNSKLDGQKALLAKTTSVKANQERIKGIIYKLEEELNEITKKKNSKMTMSAEYRANEEKMLFLCWRCTYKEDGNRFWENYDLFKKTRDFLNREKVISNFINFYSGIETRKIRFIARSNLWRIRYVNSQKTGDKLFGVPTVDYTTDMLNLSYWSNYYDNIYQMMPEDRPRDLIIEDDDALDAYMKAYYEERTREDAARRSKKKSPGKLSAFNSEEVIVTASNELWQDIEYDTPREAQKVKNAADFKKKNNR